jgi:hypothetical protein
MGFLNKGRGHWKESQDFTLLNTWRFAKLSWGGGYHQKPLEDPMTCQEQKLHRTKKGLAGMLEDTGKRLSHLNQEASHAM